MSLDSFNTEIQISGSSEDIFKALTVNIAGWWTELSNSATENGDKLTVRFEDDTLWVMQVCDVEKNSRVTWNVIQANHDLSSLKVADEWKGTSILWEIVPASQGSHLKLTHHGLVPKLECYEICNGGWTYFLDSLKKLIETGKGHPYSQGLLNP